MTMCTEQHSRLQEGCARQNTFEDNQQDEGECFGAHNAAMMEGGLDWRDEADMVDWGKCTDRQAAGTEN